MTALMNLNLMHICDICICIKSRDRARSSSSASASTIIYITSFRVCF